MNPIIKTAAESVTLGWVLGVMTVVFVCAFLFWTWYAWTPRNRQLMHDAANLPLSDGGDR